MKKLLLGLLALALGCVSLHAQDVTFTVRGGTNYGPTYNEGCEKAFDQNLSTKWFAGSGDSYVDLEASEAVYLTGYTLVNANDNKKFGGRKPTEWEFFGSNDENALSNPIGTWDGWTKIANVRGDNVNKGEDFTAYYYAMNTPASTYKYYRLKFVNAGWQLSEIIPSYSKTVLPSYTAISGVGGTGNEGYPNLFDGNTSSKLCTSDIYSPGGPYHYVIFRRSEATAVTTYSFCSGNDFDYRDPVSWELYGMNSTTTPERTDRAWELIDSKEDQEFTYVRQEWVNYNVDNPTTDTYNTFMIKITEVRNGGDMTQFQEFRLNDDTDNYATSNYTALDGVGGFDAGVTGYEDEGYDKAVDGNTDTKFCTNIRATDEGYYWVIFKTIQAMPVSGYSFATGGDAPERDPQSWKLYGMQADSDPQRDAAGWELIDTKTDAYFIRNRQAWIHYYVDNPTSNEYNYFMLQVNKLRNVETNLVQFSEFNLDGLDVATEDKLVVYRQGSGGFWDDGAAKNLVDGNPNTKLGGGFTTGGTGTYVSFGPASGESVSINGYSLQVANEWGYYDRRPKSWTLYGSNIDPAPEQDRGKWEEIHSVTADTQLPASPLVCGYYRLDQPSKPYKFFKIKFTETQGAGAIQVAELVLHYTHNDIANWIEIPDGTAPVFCGNITYKDFTYKRTFANEWATVCLPFEAQAKNGFQPYTLKETSDNYLKVESTDNAIAPYQPTIVKAAANAEVDFSGSNVVLYGTLNNPTAATAATGWTLVGSTTNGNVDPGSVNGTMFYIAQNKFWQADATAGVTVNAMRAYLVSDGTTPAKFYDITEEDVTGINTINGNDNANVNNAAVYDLQGRKVANVQRGVYIQNGKKFVVK